MPHDPTPYDAEHLRSLLDRARGFALYRVAITPRAPFGAEVVLASPSIRDVLGIRDPRDFASWFAIVHYEDLPRVLAANRRSVMTGVPFDEVFRIRRPGEQDVRWLHVVSQPVAESHGVGPTRYFDGVIVDITAFAQVFHGQRRQDDVTAGVAHDFNNLLTIVLGNLDLARDQLAGDHGARSHLDEIERAAYRAVAVTRQIMAPSLATLPAEAPQPLVPPPAVAGTTVLVADDQPALRRATACILERAGYRVLTAADGVEAVAVFRAADVPITALVLDVAMPGQSGPDALLAIRALRPGQPAVLVSADRADGRIAPLLDATTAFVAKPFRPSHLLAQVQAVARAAVVTPAGTASTASRTPPRR